MSNVMAALMNNVAHHVRDVFGVGVFVGRDNFKLCNCFERMSNALEDGVCTRERFFNF